MADNLTLPSQPASKLFVTLNSGQLIELTTVYATDGNSNLTPIASSALQQSILAELESFHSDNSATGLSIYNEIVAFHDDNSTENQALLAETQDFHSDNTMENQAILTEIENFHADNSATGLAIFNEISSFHADNSSENADILAELGSFHSDTNTRLNTLITQTDGIEGSLSSIDGKIANNYGAASGAIRVASQPGNAAGAADFNAGTTGAQTPRTTSNITRNGTELSYNAGASDANTLRTASNLKREGNDLDYNFGTVGANTLRTAAQLADAAGNQLTSQLIDSINNYRGVHIVRPDRLISSSALGSLNAAVTVSLEGEGSAGFQLSAGTLAATLTPEQSIDGGTSWYQAQFFDPVTFTVNNSLTVTNPNALTGLGIISTQGASHVRVRVSAYTSGTANGVVRAVAAAGYQAQVPQDLSDIAANRIFCFAIKTLNMATAGTDNPLILLNNPSSSTKNVYLKTIVAGISVNNVFGIFSLFGNPTVTSAGTSQTEQTRSVGSGSTPQLIVTTLPTVSASGSLLSSFLNAQNANSLQIVDSNQLKIPPNNTVLFTGDPQSNNRNAVVTVVWSES